MPSALASLLLGTLLAALEVDMRPIDQLAGFLPSSDQISSGYNDEPSQLEDFQPEGQDYPMTVRYYNNPESNEAFLSEYTPYQVRRVSAPDDTYNAFPTVGSSPLSYEDGSSRSIANPAKLTGSRLAGMPPTGNYQNKNILSSGTLNPNLSQEENLKPIANPTKLTEAQLAVVPTHGSNENNLALGTFNPNSSQEEKSRPMTNPTKLTESRLAVAPTTADGNDEQNESIRATGTSNPNFVANNLTPQADDSSSTETPTRKKSRFDELTNDIPSQTQRQTSTAPANLLADPNQTPDFGFVNHKNTDGQLRKVTYSVDTNGNIVADSSNVVKH